MSTAKVDAKKRIVLPKGRPGDVFDVQRLADGRYLLVRLERPEAKARMSRDACLDAMANAPLRPTLTWDELRKRTRQP